MVRLTQQPSFRLKKTEPGQNPVLLSGLGMEFDLELRIESLAKFTSIRKQIYPRSPIRRTGATRKFADQTNLSRRLDD